MMSLIALVITITIVIFIGNDNNRTVDKNKQNTGTNITDHKTKTLILIRQFFQWVIVALVV